MLSAWCAEGFSPAEFWQQDTSSWAAIMEGRRLLHENQADMIVAQAWWTARLSRAETIEPLAKYIRSQPAQKGPTIEEQLAQWDALASAGFGITITDMTVN